MHIAAKDSKEYQQICIDQRCSAFLQKNMQVQPLDDVDDQYHLHLSWNLFYELKADCQLGSASEIQNYREGE